MTGDRYTSNICRLKQHRIDSISERYLTLCQELNRCVYEVGFQADSKLFKTFIELLREQNINFNFDPKNNMEHGLIHKWLVENVAKGCNNERVGCIAEDICGNYKLPSTNFEYFLKTLVIFQDNMLKEKPCC